MRRFLQEDYYCILIIPYKCQIFQGPTNYELEAELGIQTSSEARIRVGQETRGWKPGKFLVYDPSFETEIWFDGATHNALRIVLSINLWHPGVPRTFRTQTIDQDSLQRDLYLLPLLTLPEFTILYTKRK